VNEALTQDEVIILRLAVEKPELGQALTAEKLIEAGYPKTHRACSLWINRLQRRGMLEGYLAASWHYWSITEKGREAIAVELAKVEA